MRVKEKYLLQSDVLKVLAEDSHLSSAEKQRLIQTEGIRYLESILINSYRAGDLSETEVQTITQIIDDPMGNGIPSWFLNRQKDFKTGKFSQLASNLLDTQLRDDLERLKKIRFSLY